MIASRILDDVVVDIAVEVDSRGVDLDDVVGGLVVPGVVLLRSASRDRLWVTTVVAARDEQEAVSTVRARVLAQLGAPAGAVRATEAAGVMLGELYGWLDHTDPAQDPGAEVSPGRADLLDLVAAHVWDHPRLPRHRERVVALAGTA